MPPPLTPHHPSHPTHPNRNHNQQVVSKMSKGNKSAGQILAELGPMGVWGGLGTRIIMIGTLTGLQWCVFVPCVTRLPPNLN